MNITVVFPSPQRRSEWELAVADAKNKLGMYTANTRSSPSAGLLLGQRRRCWTNINPALAQLLGLSMQ